MAGRLRIRLIQPSRYLRGRLRKLDRQLFPSLTLPLLAALSPPDAEVSLRYDLFEEVGFDDPADLVGITVYTSQAFRAYEIADRFRRRGTPVVLGGIHASLLPDEAAGHADTVIVGEAEELWPRFLEDFRAGRARARYAAERPPDLAGLPAPKYSLLDPARYASWGWPGAGRLLPAPPELQRLRGRSTRAVPS